MHLNTLKMRIRHPIRWYHPALNKIPGELRVSVWKRIAVSMERRFIYVRIPKAANSTISLTLAKPLYPEYARSFTNERRGDKAKKVLDAYYRHLHSQQDSYWSIFTRLLLSEILIPGFYQLFWIRFSQVRKRSFTGWQMR